MASSNPLADVYGNLLIVRPPVPATVNKAGANYKSEVAHLEYSPRRAYDEWLSILDAIVACGGDAIYQFEAADEPLLDRGPLEVAGDGSIRPLGSREVVGRLDDVMTGRVFAANGPWVSVRDGALRAVMPNMLDHRRAEAAYYRDLLGELACAAGLALDIADNPHRWEGMADIAAVGDRVVLTYAVPGHYDHATTPKSSRSTRAGVAFAAEFTGVPESARIYAELVYPHFHGDTVHFGARPTTSEASRGGGALPAPPVGRGPAPYRSMALRSRHPSRRSRPRRRSRPLSTRSPRCTRSRRARARPCRRRCRRISTVQ